MPLSLQSPEDICNDALVRIGWKGARIGSLYDGSEAAKKALDIYAQTRDMLLRWQDWGFAERNVTLTLLLSAPIPGYVPGATPWTPGIHPILPWRYEYAYPVDALKVRSIRRAEIFLRNYDPTPKVWRVANDPALVDPDGAPSGQQVILCDVANAILVYTGQVTDPADWESEFAETLAASLGRRLAPALTGLDAAKLEAADEQTSGAMAETRQG